MFGNWNYHLIRKLYIKTSPHMDYPVMSVMNARKHTLIRCQAGNELVNVVFIRLIAED